MQMTKFVFDCLYLVAKHPGARLNMQEPRVMTVLAYLSPEDGSTGSVNFVTGVKSRSEVNRAGALRPIRGQAAELRRAGLNSTCPLLCLGFRPLCPKRPRGRKNT